MVLESCKVCNQQEAKYKCPGCSAKTCSSLCSNQHKSESNCSGTRNKAAYLHLKDYTWGAMMDDYVYLEDTSRQISSWGSQITKNRLRKPTGQQRRSSKRETLKEHLESLEIHMELAPQGMHRQMQNRSTWKQKYVCLPIIFSIITPVLDQAQSF